VLVYLRDVDRKSRSGRYVSERHAQLTRSGYWLTGITGSQRKL
jgi:hypothetical protein